MKILLDENFPVKLKEDFLEYEVHTVTEMKWNSLKNGNLLKLMEENSFEFLITLDKKLKYQQNLDKFSIRIILFDVKDARISKLKLLIKKQFLFWSYEIKTNSFQSRINYIG